MTNHDSDHINKLIEASRQLERLGLGTEELRQARKAARNAIALAIGGPAQATRLDQQATTLTEQARARARLAKHATENYRLFITTATIARAATTLRDAIRATIASHDADQVKRQNPN